MKLLTIMTLSLLIIGCSASKVNKKARYSGDQGKNEAIALQKVNPGIDNAEASSAFEYGKTKTKKTRVKQKRAGKKFHIPWLAKKQLPSPVKAAKGRLGSKIDKTGAILLVIALLVGIILILTLLETGTAAFIGTALVATAILLFAVLILILLGYIQFGY